MINMKINSRIGLNMEEVPPSLLEQIEQELRFENPAYQKALKLGFWPKGPREIVLYEKEKETIWLPRGYGKRLQHILITRQIPFMVQDERLLLPPVDFRSSIVLRDYQKTAVNALVVHRQGGVVAPCGSGKTIILLESMARIGQPALWITHTYELLEQVVERVCSVFDITRDEIGIIADGKCKIGDRLTISLIQSLYKQDVQEIGKHFGAIFVDEAHHLAANTFYHTVGRFPSHYRLWASATPNRKDGLTRMVFAAGGPILHTISKEETMGFVVTPTVQMVPTPFKAGVDEGDPNKRNAMLQQMIADEQRNRIIVDTVLQNAKGNYSLILSDRVEHLFTLRTMLQERMPDIEIEILTSNTNKKQRKIILEKLASREIDILLAVKIAREGLDISHLNRLFLVTPKRPGEDLEQEIGRIARPFPGKTAVVFDFCDDRDRWLGNMAKARRQMYQKMGMRIINVHSWTNATQKACR